MTFDIKFKKDISKFVFISMKIIPAIFAGMIFSSCGEDNPLDDKVDFDRKAMLVNWADNIIMPAYDQFQEEAENLNNSVLAFTNKPEIVRFQDLTDQFKTTYRAFQQIKTFEVGPAQELAMRASLNTYPADTVKIAGYVSTRNYNFSAASGLTARGFPAMDYLLFSNSFDFVNDADSRAYLKALSADILDLATKVNSKWDNYRGHFVNASGTDMGSSVGQMVNAMNKDYELIKNAKIGFPAGKKTLGKPYPHTCEAYFSGYSIELAEANLKAIHNFYRGIYFDESQNGISLQDYLEELGTQYSGTPLDLVIDDQFKLALEDLQKIPGPLSEAIVIHKTEVDKAYLEIQRNVKYLKVDMPSSMGVLITYQDNDGD